MMRAEEWEEIKRIFESALERSSSDRAKYLDSVCGSNFTLRQTVDELLHANEDASGFLDETQLRRYPAVFQPGELVAERFRIIRLISRGGMGEVYETFDERLSIGLALKTLRPEFASDADAIERFRREIRVTRDCGHPNLCRVYELVEHHLAPDEMQPAGRVVTCLTMQLMSGENLQQYLKRVGPLSPKLAFPLIDQIVGAVSALHENGIIHRDLKPSNIMVTMAPNGEGRATVMDFGLTKPLAKGQDLFESTSDFQAGAPFFLAPELVAGEKPSVASDVYALGLIIDEMVTGGGAFAGATVEAVLYQKLWGEPEDPLVRSPSLPVNWALTIRRCLHRDPSKRFASSREIVCQLEVSTGSVMQPIPVVDQTSQTGVTASPRLRSAPFRLRLRTVVLGCFLLIAAGAVLFGFNRSRPVNMSVLTFQFENLTGKNEYDYLCKGMTREVERRLLQLPGVQVVPYHEPRPKDASLKTDARFSVEGQLELSQKSPRLSVSVIENSTGTLICCATTFENSLADPLEMQSDIASSAVNAMRAAVLLPNLKESDGIVPKSLLLLWRKFPSPQTAQAGGSPTNNTVAMQIYMRAHALLEERTLPSLLRAADLYKEAIREDSQFALAYCDLATVERALVEFNAAPRSQLLASAKAHALQAVAIGPRYAESYAELAVINQYSWELGAAAENFKRSISINPRLAYVHRRYGGLLIQFGKFDEGINQTRTAISLDPYNLSERLFLGTYLHYAGRPAEATETVEHFLSEKDFPVGHNILGYAYAHRALQAKGAQRRRLLDRAIEEADIVSKGDNPSQEPIYAGASLPMYALFYALRGDSQQATKYLNKLLVGQRIGAVDPFDIAFPYVALGNTKAAMSVIRRAAAEKESALLYLKVDPFLEPLRSSAEFKALIAQVGL